MHSFAIFTKKDAEKLLSCITTPSNSKKHPNNTSFLGHTSILLSLDLGKTTEKIEINSEEKIALIRGEKISFKEFEKTKEETFYTIIQGKVLAIELFGNETNLYYKLKPTKDWPTLMLSSVPMHRFKTISPKTSAELMVKEISPVKGIVLDCCCGLGYTSIIEANFEACEKVIVFEKDPNVLEIAKYNPFSEELFSNKKINLNKGSVYAGIKKIESNSVDRVLHDPPTVSFAKELYSLEFYDELYRILKPNGILYHYCPNPGKTKGTEFWPVLEKMLKKSGFENVKYNPLSSGIRAVKKLK
jgi:predicted methyltransferase